jgi:hypothetical protein
MSESDDGDEQWTQPARERFEVAAAELVRAIEKHARVVRALSSPGDVSQVFAVGNEVARIGDRLADAQMDFTGVAYPFGLMRPDLEQEVDDGEVEEDAGSVSGFSLLRRDDFAVTDEQAVLEGGRRAYLDVWPDDSERDATADVTDLGRALYQLAHAHGWDDLKKASGLRPTAGTA